MFETDIKTRKSTRQQNHDYKISCVYFVTTCVDWHVDCLGQIVNVREWEQRDREWAQREGRDPPLHSVCESGRTLFLNDYGKIVEQQWLWLANQYPYVSLDEYVVMPNHFHGIIIIDASEQPSSVKIKSLSELVGAFKTTSSKIIHQAGLIDFAWQRSFHDRIIHNPIELDRVRAYIKNNPNEWK